MTTRIPPLPLFAVGLLLVIAVALAARWRGGDLDRPFETDEADYVRAMAPGLGPIYLGSRERSGVAFLIEVVDEYRRTGWARPFKRDWELDDAAGLRHYHPPPAFYPIGAMISAGVNSERAIRLVPVTTGLLGALATMWLAWVLLDGTSTAIRWWLSVAAGLFLATSPYHVVSSTTISPHAAFSLLSAVALACFTRATQEGERRWWWAGCASLGAAMLTVPYWLLLAPAAVWSWWTLPADRRTFRQLIGGVLVAVVAATIVWPPILTEVAFVKPALMYGGIILKPLVTDTTPGLWIVEMAGAHRVMTATALVALAALLLIPRERVRPFVPAALFVIVFLLLNLRVGHMKPMYAAGVLPPLAALVVGLAGWGLARLGSQASAPAPAAAVVIVLAWLVTMPPQVSSPEWRSSFDQLNRSLSGRRVLVTPRAAAAMIKYYMPGAVTVPDSGESADVAHLRASLAANELDAVLRWGGTMEPNGVAAAVIASRAPGGRVEISHTPVSWWVIDAASGPARPAE